MRYQFSDSFCCQLFYSVRSLDDVEAKLIDTDKETEKARKEVKVARDEFNTVKKKRCCPIVVHVQVEVGRTNDDVQHGPFQQSLLTYLG